MNPDAKRILILGAYGLIGSAIARRLTAAGHLVTGLGRDPVAARKVLPNISWQIADVAGLLDPNSWGAHLQDIDVVINCTGALQDGHQDDLEALHHHAVAALSKACASCDAQLIQISAVGATPEARTDFLSSKSRGDAAIKASGCRYQILRPGLVLSETAYGGTAMLRMLAAVPVIQPLAFADAPIQTVSTNDLASAVHYAVSGDVPNGFEGDLVEPTPRPLGEIVAQMRHWLGFPRATRQLHMPRPILAVLIAAADGLSHLGWRSPLRRNAVTVLQDGVTGDPTPWANLGLMPVAALKDTLASMPARAEDRMSARISLVMPLLVATLSLFWLVSGLIGLFYATPAARVLQDVGWPYPLAVSSVVFWAIVDMVLGVAILFRKHSAMACWAMIAVSAIYLMASSLVTPHLWGDPLGPLVKILPAMALALVARITLETR